MSPVTEVRRGNTSASICCQHLSLVPTCFPLSYECQAGNTSASNLKHLDGFRFVEWYRTNAGTFPERVRPDAAPARWFACRGKKATNGGGPERRHQAPRAASAG